MSRMTPSGPKDDCQLTVTKNNLPENAEEENFIRIIYRDVVCHPAFVTIWAVFTSWSVLTRFFSRGIVPDVFSVSILLDIAIGGLLTIILVIMGSVFMLVMAVMYVTYMHIRDEWNI